MDTNFILQDGFIGLS